MQPVFTGSKDASDEIAALVLGPVMARIDYANTFAEYQEALAPVGRRRERRGASQLIRNPGAEHAATLRGAVGRKLQEGLDRLWTTAKL